MMTDDPRPPEDAGPGDMMLLPCGCRVYLVNDAMVMEVCAVGEACEYVQLAARLIREQGKPVETAIL